MQDQFIPRSGEKLEFKMTFHQSKRKRLNFGFLKTSFLLKELTGQEGETTAELTIDLLIDSPIKTINLHNWGTEIINTKFMNTLECRYFVQDEKRIIEQEYTFNPADQKIQIDETVKRVHEKEKRPLTNIFRKGPAQIYDHLALLYKIRILDLRLTQIVSLAVLYYNGLWPILVEYQYNEKKKFKGKEYETRVYGLRSNKGKLPLIKKQLELQTARIWITDDETRLPLLIEVVTQKGKITVELEQNH